MTYIKGKVIHGHGPYYYLVRSQRINKKVKTIHVRYLGKNPRVGPNSAVMFKPSPGAETLEFGHGNKLTTSNRLAKIAHFEMRANKVSVQKFQVGKHGSSQERSIKTAKPDSSPGFFEFMHELGHVVKGHDGSEPLTNAQELEATNWAFERAKLYGVQPTKVWEERHDKMEFTEASKGKVAEETEEPTFVDTVRDFKERKK